MTRIIRAFWDGLTGHVSRRETIHEDRKVRRRLNEKQIDKMIMDSFPASDPPSTY